VPYDQLPPVELPILPPAAAYQTVPPIPPFQLLEEYMDLDDLLLPEGYFQLLQALPQQGGPLVEHQPGSRGPPPR
jgi:hypothetical protein